MGTSNAFLFFSLKDLDDMNIEIMRNTLYKAYLEDFYRFCQVTSSCTYAGKDLLDFFLG